MGALLILFGFIALIVGGFLAIKSVIRQKKGRDDYKVPMKKARIALIAGVMMCGIGFSTLDDSDKAKETAQETTQTAQQAPVKEEKAAEPAKPAEPEKTKEAKQIDIPAVYDVAADKQALTDYVNSTVGAKYKITNLNVSEYSDGVYQIMFECRDSKYSDAESAKAAGKEIRELMPDFPCKVDIVAVTFKGGAVSYSPSNPKMQIVSAGQKGEF